jgi:hypothetical protein
VEALAARGGVRIATGGRGRAYRGSPSRGLAPAIRVPDVRGQVSYFVALLELGHLLSPGNRSLRQLEAEADAWRWALAVALVEPTAATARSMHRALSSYLERTLAKRRYGYRTFAAIPPDESFFWAVLAELEARAGG